MFYVYLLHNKMQSRFYVGSTNALEARLREHNAGRVQSTRAYRPWEMLYYEAYPTEELARKRERRLKAHGNALRELKKRLDIFGSTGGAGYTLIELAIALAVFGILAVTLLVGFRGADKLEKFRLDSNILAATIRDVQNRALSGSVDSSGSFPRGGYGLSLAACTTPPCLYRLWQELDDPPDQHLTTPGTEVTSERTLSPYTHITSIRVQDPDGSNGGNVARADISFKPPRPTPFVWYPAGVEPPPSAGTTGLEAKQVLITLTFALDPSIQRVVEVKGISGQISEYVP